MAINIYYSRKEWGPVHVNIPRDVLAKIENFDSFKTEEEIGKSQV